MAKHSNGGLRSLETVIAPDRVVTRLSPIQTWILKQTVSDPTEWHSLPPCRAIIHAAQRLVHRGLVVLDREATRAKYRPLAAAEIVARSEKWATRDMPATTGARVGLTRPTPVQA